MNTFYIIARLWYFENLPRHPLVRMERQHAPRWKDYESHFRLFQRRLWQLGLAILIIGVIMEVFSLSRVSFLLLSVTIFIPLVGIALAGGGVITLVLWPILIALSGGGVIAPEKEAQTWTLLLVTPMARLDLLLAKLVVGLSRQQRFILLSMGLQFFPMLAVASLVGNLLRAERGVVPMLVMGLTMLLFVYERMQVFVLSGLLGLAASLTAGSWPMAMSGATALGSLLVLGRVILTYGIMVVLAGGKMVDTGQAVFLGLSGIAPAGREAWQGLLILSGLLIGQEAVIWLLVRWMIRKMGGD